MDLFFQSLNTLKGRFRNRFLSAHETVFQGGYVEWRAKRLAAIVTHYGPSFFLGKKLLEVGCGFGDIGGFFSSLGAEVTCSDARQEHLTIVRRRYPYVKTILANLENEWPFGEFDIIIHMGVLYHLKDFQFSLAKACRGCNHLILETEVSDSDDPTFSMIKKENGYDQAFSSEGTRPSAPMIEKCLEEQGMKFERINDDRCNSQIHRYDWKVENTGRQENGLRRFWYVKKGE